MGRKKTPPSPYAPSIAYKLSMEALSKGDLDKAKEYLEHMVSSDRTLMERRIEAKRLSLGRL